MTFAESLKNLRNLKGITQEVLAKDTKIGRSTIAMYEAGRRQPDLETLELLADYFNVDTDTLLGKQRGSTYCLYPETAMMAQFLHDNPTYKVMFNTSKKLSPKALKEVQKFIDYQLSKEDPQKDE